MQAMSEIHRSPSLAALKRVVHEVEQGVSHLGWDRPPALFALVSTSALLETPDLPGDVGDQLRASWDGSPEHLSAILQEDFGTDDLERGLAQIAWPDTVSGAIVSVEMVTLPPQAEAEIPDDPEAAAVFAAAHPARAEVRFTVGVLQSGESWCAVRAKSYDDDASVGTGEALMPGLVEALRGGFA